MEQSGREFVTKLGSEEPTPGGGGAAALVGAVGAALLRMVAVLTAGRLERKLQESRSGTEWKSQQDELGTERKSQQDGLGAERKSQQDELVARVKELAARAEELQQRLLDEVEADEAGFQPLAEAYRMGKDEPRRAERLEKAKLGACQAPMAVMEWAAAAAPVAAELAEKSGKLVVSDAGCAAAALKAAMEMAYLNILVNVRGLGDRTQAEALKERGRELLAGAGEELERVNTKVRKELAQ